MSDPKRIARHRQRPDGFIIVAVLWIMAALAALATIYAIYVSNTGAALSVKAVTGVPIKFIGVGEQLDRLEEFHPDRMASRILGGGDLATLLEKAQREFDADINRLNPRGGSIGLGRPGPASGLRSLATTLSALEATGGRLGIQVSEGLGSAGDALLLELLPRSWRFGPNRSNCCTSFSAAN